MRHAYFTGGDKPYEKRQRALKTEVDEAAWAELYTTKSRPFDWPDTGQIAVKVINHDGDKVLRVFGGGVIQQEIEQWKKYYGVVFYGEIHDGKDLS